MQLFTSNFKLFRNYLDITQDKLAKLLDVDPITVTGYETGKTNPSMNVLKKCCTEFGISLDYLYRNQSCTYPRNLKLLKLAKILDDAAFSNSRSSIEVSIRSLLGVSSGQGNNFKLDNIEIELSASFHNNLKSIRNLKNLKQSQLAESINVSRVLLAKYEQNTFPPIERLFDLSTTLDISMHALITGEKLFFDYDDRIFGRAILSADQNLSLNDQKVLIRLMEATINNKT